jgi:hypothetical protein
VPNNPDDGLLAENGVSRLVEVIVAGCTPTSREVTGAQGGFRQFFDRDGWRARRIEQTDFGKWDTPPRTAAIASSFYNPRRRVRPCLPPRLYREHGPIHAVRNCLSSKVVSRGSDLLALLAVDSLLGYRI